MVDYWWFDSLGYAFYFSQRLLYRYLVFLGVTALFFCIFFFNFWIASRYLGTVSPPPANSKPQSKEAYRKVLRMFRTGSMSVYTPLSLVLGIVIALPLFERWEAFLLFVFGPEAAIADPVYGKDISYYLFSFPIYTLLQRRIFISFAILLDRRSFSLLAGAPAAQGAGTGYRKRSKNSRLLSGLFRCCNRDMGFFPAALCAAVYIQL